MSIVSGTNESFWAWLAGFVDGEGYFILRKIKNRQHYKTGFAWAPRLIIANNDRHTLEVILEKVGRGSLHSIRHGCWQVHFTSGQLREFILPYIIPHLITKHDEATLLLKACTILGNRTRSSTLTEIELSELCEKMKVSRERNLHG